MLSWISTINITEFIKYIKKHEVHQILINTISNEVEILGFIAMRFKINHALQQNIIVNDYLNYLKKKQKERVNLGGTYWLI